MNNESKMMFLTMCQPQPLFIYDTFSPLWNIFPYAIQMVQLMDACSRLDAKARSIAH